MSYRPEEYAVRLVCRKRGIHSGRDPIQCERVRKRLGLSAGELGLLLGVSTQTIYNWESGKARPHRKLMPTLVALRTVGKRETLARLSEVKKAA